MLLDLEQCPSCTYKLPDTMKELEEVLKTDNRFSDWLDDSDYWYCPNCDKDLTCYWSFDDLIWHDNEADMEFAEYYEYHVCCDTYTVTCNCPTTVTFDELKERLEARDYDMEDFYFQSDDAGMDCSSCKHNCTQRCMPLLRELTRLKNRETILPLNIEPCSDYEYNPDQVLSYDFKAMTQQAIKVRYPVILGKKKTYA